jgi:transposase
MLLLVLKGIMQTRELSAKVGVSSNCISPWKQLYETQGISGLLVENRGGHKQGGISKEAHEQIKSRLCDPKGGFTSYKQAMEWINERFGLQMPYQAVNKYLKYHFATKFKVARKSHVKKDPLAAATFKKGTSR